MLPIEKLLEQIPTYVHPLNQHLIKRGKGSNLKLLPRTTVKVLTYNMCLVPWIADGCFPTPYVKERMTEFLINHL